MSRNWGFLGKSIDNTARQWFAVIWRKIILKFFVHSQSIKILWKRLWSSFGTKTQQSAKNYCAKHRKTAFGFFLVSNFSVFTARVWHFISWFNEDFIVIFPAVQKNRPNDLSSLYLVFFMSWKKWCYNFCSCL